MLFRSPEPAGSDDGDDNSTDDGATDDGSTDDSSSEDDSGSADAIGPGFGLLAAVVAVLSLALLARRAD